MFIKSNFPTWYSSLCVDSTNLAAEAEQRLSAITSLVSNLDNDCFLEIETLIGLSLGMKNLDNDTQNKLLNTISNAEENFNVRNNGQEIQLFAATALLLLMQEKQHSLLCSLTSLMVTSSFFKSKRPHNLPFDLYSTANNSLKEMSIIRRRISRINNINIDFTFDDEITVDTKKYFSKLTSEFNNRIISFRKHLEIQSEEQQALWWLTNAFSERLSLPFSKVDIPTKTLIAPIELAELTKVAPGIPSVKALLSRIGINNRSVKIVNFLADQKEEILTSLLDNNISPITTPLHFAISKICETGPDGEWQGYWSSVCNIDANISIPGLDLAEQIYLERLILQALDND